MFRCTDVPRISCCALVLPWVQMNVLHIHLSDWAGVRFEVPAYPELTAGLNGQYYTAQDAAQLVQYGQERGIRIVPEVWLLSRAHCTSLAFSVVMG
jgi:N-acetyl-beta-hexosaminidase